MVMQVVTVLGDEQERPSHPPMTFSDDDFKGITPHEHDPMVIEVTMATHKVHRVLLDQGSSTDIMYWSTFMRLGLAQELLLPFSRAMIRFAGDSVEVKGYVDLLTSFGLRPNSKVVRVKSLLVNAPSSYNVIMGRAPLNDLGAVVLTVHLTMKFPFPDGNIGVVKADQVAARRCYKDS
ncbi:hypothetical protein SESBI_42974 [Sesbania bispinosa]|nr:hypothetical protein SESBI_42974 [Sesbania bispinosa]